MMLVMMSDMSNVRGTVIAELGELASGRVLIVNSAGPDTAPGKPRGGTAATAYAKEGASVQVADLLAACPVDISDVDVVHFTGGDPFRLLRACRETGFIEAMEKRAAEGPFAVVGSSAGAMVMGRDIGHASILCDPKGMDTTGFCWMDVRVMPHLDLKGRYGDVIRAHVAANPHPDWLLLKERDVLVGEIERELGEAPSLG